MSDVLRNFILVVHCRCSDARTPLMPGMATFEESPSHGDAVPAPFRHSGARAARRVDKRPAHAFEPSARKKCGHCQVSRMLAVR